MNNIELPELNPWQAYDLENKVVVDDGNLIKVVIPVKIKWKTPELQDLVNTNGIACRVMGNAGEWHDAFLKAIDVSECGAPYYTNMGWFSVCEVYDRGDITNV